MATENRTRITVEEFRKLDHLPRFAQLVDGEVVVNAAKRSHQLPLGRIFLAVSHWADAQPGRGMAWLELDVEIDGLNLYVPDLLWASEARMSELRDSEDLAPDLCVEVRSPSTWRFDIGAKKRGYERGGLPELWLVDTDAESVLVYRRARAESPEFDVALELARPDTLTSPLLPGFAYELEDLFAPLRPRR
jgi:Uma2 family endonuclease